MPLAIVTSDVQSRHTILFVLNIIGVIACICLKILLVLTAFRLIFKEPDISLVMQEHVSNYSKLSNLIIGRRAPDGPFPPIEDTYLYYLDMFSDIN